MGKDRELVDRGIYLSDSGVWWAWSMTKSGYAHSLHTKDKAKAQAMYNERLQELREYIAKYPEHWKGK